MLNENAKAWVAALRSGKFNMAFCLNSKRRKNMNPRIKPHIPVRKKYTVYGTSGRVIGHIEYSVLGGDYYCFTQVDGVIGLREETVQFVADSLKQLNKTL